MDIDPGSLLLHRHWTMWLKANNAAWKKENFKRVFTLKNVKEMWQLLNNIPVSIAGQANIFFMSEELVPLTEERQDLWKQGGCWSTIVKENNWVTTMQDICASTFGETVFGDDVKGLCIVPVSANHCIVKMWTTRKSEATSAHLHKSLCHLGCCAPRFKSF